MVRRRSAILPGDAPRGEAGMTLARELPLLVAVLAVVAVGIWLALDTAPPREPGDLVERGAAEAVPTAGDEPRAADVAAVPLRVEGRDVDVPDYDAPIDGLDVDLLVVDGRGAPVAAALVEVYADRVDDALDQLLAVGAPLASALVPRRTARTGGDGRVELADVPAIARIVARTDDGRVSRAARGIALSDAARAVLVVDHAPRVDVEVVDGDGRGVSGAVVRIDSSRAASTSGEPWVHGSRVTDADGRARLTVPRDVFGVSAIVDGIATERAWVDVTGPRTLRLHAPTGRAIEGRVRARGADGELVPVPDAVVRLGLTPGSPVPPGLVDVEVDASTRSDDDGRFVLPVPIAGRFRLSAAAPGWSARRGHEVALFGDERRRDVELRLDPFTTFAGTVVDERGAPVDVGRVVAQWAAGDGGDADDVPNRRGDVGPDGRFTIERIERSGRYGLWYEPPGAAFGGAPTGRGALVDVQPGARDLRLVVRDDDGAFVHPFNRRVGEAADEVPVGDAALRLDVRGADGEPLARVLVARERRTPSGWRTEGQRRLSRAERHHLVDELLDGAEYRFTLHAGGHGVVRTDGVFAARDAPIVRVVLPPAARLEVVVRTRDGPAAYAEIELTLPDERRAWPSRRADADGRVVYDDLLPGRYEIAARLAERAGTASVELTAGDERLVDVELP